MKISATFFLIIFSFCAFAQVQIDKPLQFTGSGTNAKVTGIQEVINNPDAANKIYVDTAIANRTAGSASIPNGTVAGQMLYWNGSAWVTIAPGTYGSLLSFCNGVPQWGGCPPAVTTDTISFSCGSCSGTTANCGGNVTNTGGTTVTARGVCWSTSPNPTLANSFSNDGTGGGTFSSSLSGLTAGTTYYVRAYATNSAGTSYGNQVTFVPLPAFTYNGVTTFVYTSNFSGSWANSYGIIGVTSSTDGEANTATIVANQGNSGSYAALQCSNLVAYGQSDWYLPSQGELSTMYTNRTTLGLPTGVGDYWSSNEYCCGGVNQQQLAQTFQFPTGCCGAGNNQNKLSGFAFRCIRK